MTPWRVITFNTNNPIYIETNLKLTESLHKFNIPYTHGIIPELKTWRSTTISIHQEILRMLDAYEENLVLLDADCIVQQYPALFDTITEDIGVHYRDGKELLAGTVYLRNCDKVKHLVMTWAENSKNDAQAMSDQTGLAKTLKNGDYSVNILPAPYNLIFDSMAHQGPAVIEHFQASRRSRKILP